jgi:large subunit ribosomal protein L25
MAQSATIVAKKRTELGSRANKRLRDSGSLPGVVYGHKEAVIPVSLPKKEIVGHLTKGTHLFDISLEGKSEKVLVKEVQYDHLGLEVLHVDFARVSLDEKVKVIVPLELRGKPKGEAEGGKLAQLIADIEIECLVTDIPAYIRHDVSELGLNSTLHISELKLPANVRVLVDGHLIVATVKEIVESAAGDAAAVAEPEVIGKKKEDGEAEAAPAKK